MTSERPVLSELYVSQLGLTDPRRPERCVVGFVFTHHPLTVLLAHVNGQDGSPGVGPVYGPDNSPRSNILTET